MPITAHHSTGRDHTPASPPDSRRAWSGAATARDRAARPARPPPSGRTGQHDRGADSAVVCRLARPHRARGRGACTGRRGQDEPADRRDTVYHPQDRQRPRLKDPRQAGGHRSRRGRCDRPPARPRQAMTPPLAPSITRRLIERFLHQPVLATPGSKPLHHLTTRARGAGIHRSRALQQRDRHAPVPDRGHHQASCGPHLSQARPPRSCPSRRLRPRSRPG